MTGRTRLTIVAAVATLLAAMPLGTLTMTQEWLIPAVVAITFVAGAGWLLRQRHVPRLAIVGAQLVLLLLWAGVLVAADVAWMGFVPNTEWANRLIDVTAEGFDAAATYAPPVPIERGLLLLLVVGIGLVAIAVDALAVSFNRVPGTGPLLAANYAVTAAILGGDLDWIWFALPALGFLMLLAAEGRARVAMWGRSATPSARHSGIPETSSLSRSGRRVGGVALGVAVIVPAVLPALSDGVIDGGWGGGSGSGSGRTIRVDNPVVDMQRNLNMAKNVPAVRYVTNTDRREYLRVATLDVFDGDGWTLRNNRRVPSEQRVSADVEMPDPQGLRDVDVELIDYSFELTDNYPWLSLALPYPTRVVDIDGDYRYDAVTLDVHHADEDPRGATYRTVSMDFERDPERMRAAPSPGREFDELTELPDGMADELSDYIDEAIGDADNAYDQAVAMQDWFRTSGGFFYDIEVPESGTSSDELVNFLEVRVGFCQQYATTMAVIARALDIPARVASGFTPGEQDEDGTWVVGTHDAHAWPELYFEGIGWVPFEPTPAIRTGSAPEWTQPLDLDSDNEGDDTDAPDTSTAAPNGMSPDNELDSNLGAGGIGGVSDTPSQLPTIAGAVAGLAALLLLPRAIAWSRRELRWRRAAADPIDEAEAAWADLRDAVKVSSLPWNPAATPRRIGARVAHDCGIDADNAELLDHIVTRTERARYAPTVERVPGMKGDATMLRRAIIRSQPWHRRLRAWIWPPDLHDLVSQIGARFVDGLEWLDRAGQRIRGRAVSLLPARTKQAPSE